MLDRAPSCPGEARGLSYGHPGAEGGALPEQVAAERRNVEESFRYAAEHLKFSV